jgi:hypothetical protein
MADLHVRVRWTLSPPRVRLEHAAIDVALSVHDVASRFRVLADACQSRETTTDDLLGALAQRRRVRDRAQLQDLLSDWRPAPARSSNAATWSSSAGMACPLRIASETT